jgi:hypothetical protein
LTADRFLELFRAIGGDAYLSDAGDVVIAGPPALIEAIRWRVATIGKSALVEALEQERALAEARLRERGIAPRRATALARDVTSQPFEHAIAEAIP